MYPEKPLFLKTPVVATAAEPETSGAFLLAASNLSDLTNVPQARINLGLGTAATANGSDFDPAGAAAAALRAAEAYTDSHVTTGALLRVNNLSDLTNVPNARDNLILGSGDSVNFDVVTAATALLTPGIIQGAIYKFPEIFSYPTSGTITIDTSIANQAVIGLTGNATIVLAASGLGAREIYWLSLKNTTGGALTVTWPAVTVTDNTLPTTLAAGVTMTARFNIHGTTLASVNAQYVGPIISSGGTVTSVAVGAGAGLTGRGLSASPSPITGSGTLTAFDPNTVNVKDYGAKGDGTTNDDSAIATAVTAALALATVATATLYFPQGTYLLANAVQITSASNVCRLVVKGDGMHSSVLLQGGAQKNGLYVDVSNSNATSIKSQVEVHSLGFWTVAGVDGLTALTVDYGTGAFDQHYNGGSSVHDVFFYNNTTNTGGWRNGLRMRNCWASFVKSAWGYGNSSNYFTDTSAGSFIVGREYTIRTVGTTSFTSIGATANTVGVVFVATGAGSGSGTAAQGAGSGGFIVIEGATNQTLQELYYEYQYEGVQLVPLGGVGTNGLVPQGVTVDGITCVETALLMHSYRASGGSGADSVRLDNWLCDNGNNSFAKHGVMKLESCSAVWITNGDSRMIGGTSHIQLVDCHFVFGNSINFEGVGDAVKFQNGGVSPNSSNNVFLGCIFNGLGLTFDTNCFGNQVNNTQTSTITDANITAPANRFLGTCF